MSRGPKPRPALERVWERLEQRAPDECWPWPGARDDAGYGKIDSLRVTRVILGLEPGNPLRARHTCDNPPCCNPAHLVAGTQLQNMADMKARRRSPRGERRPNAKLTPPQVQAIRADRRSGQQIAADFGISGDLVARIKRGERWEHLPAAGPVVPLTRHRYSDLSPRQLEVLRGIADGLPSAEIARRLDITVGSVAEHTKRMFAKLGAWDRANAVFLGIQAGYVPVTIQAASGEPAA